MAFVVRILLCKNLKIKIYKTIILPVLLCGCEIWSLTLREECRLRVFENTIPGRRWEDNIRMDLEEIGITAGNCVDSAQDRDYWRALVNAALNFRVP